MCPNQLEPGETGAHHGPGFFSLYKAAQMLFHSTAAQPEDETAGIRRQRSISPCTSTLTQVNAAQQVRLFCVSVMSASGYYTTANRCQSREADRLLTIEPSWFLEVVGFSVTQLTYLHPLHWCIKCPLSKLLWRAGRKRQGQQSLQNALSGTFQFFFPKVSSDKNFFLFTQLFISNRFSYLHSTVNESVDTRREIGYFHRPPAWSFILEITDLLQWIWLLIILRHNIRELWQGVILQYFLILHSSVYTVHFTCCYTSSLDCLMEDHSQSPSVRPLPSFSFTACILEPSELQSFASSLFLISGCWALIAFSSRFMLHHLSAAANNATSSLMLRVCRLPYVYCCPQPVLCAGRMTVANMATLKKHCAARAVNSIETVFILTFEHI